MGNHEENRFQRDISMTRGIRPWVATGPHAPYGSAPEAAQKIDAAGSAMESFPLNAAVGFR